MHHIVAFSEPGVYAGWPANHGLWQWGNEIVAGFLSGVYDPGYGSMHSIRWPFAKRLIRSTDGGEKWFPIERTFEFKPAFRDLRDTPSINWDDPDLALRFCGDYDHGGDADRTGGFYLSLDRCRQWAGPYKVQGPWDDDNRIICTSRTAYLKDRKLVFLSRGLKGEWGRDRVFCARYTDGRFEFASWVDDDDGPRAVMPAVVESNGILYVAMRRRLAGVSWVDLSRSDDDGRSWKNLGVVGGTGIHNGNPPALVALPDGDLLCAYGQRTAGAIVVNRIAQDVIGLPYVIRCGDYQDSTGDHFDIGYPQMFLRPNGQVVCLYYWATNDRPHQHIAASIFDPAYVTMGGGKL